VRHLPESRKRAISLARFCRFDLVSSGITRTGVNINTVFRREEIFPESTETNKRTAAGKPADRLVVLRR